MDKHYGLIFLAVILSALVVGCSIHRQVPIIQQEKVIVEKEIIERIDTVLVELPRESYDTIKADSSHLETTYAVSDAKIDTNGNLRHFLANKEVKLPVQVKTIEKIVQRDSLITIEKPVEVEVPTPYVPTIYKICLWITLLLIIGIILKICRKFIC